ncbi:guanine nucleotide exchange c9orf72 [Anaeramoeba ignava]|uniref:Guanine nucleotide exchange c9orf72 n=1 Tax=Anaeramoeba ignava TaxID=1746090 RepID=A0A9Q0LL28_ANAIG|nr:guanine nucleotide exchange c9orf72 [Anaeramoeba ignava]
MEETNEQQSRQNSEIKPKISSAIQLSLWDDVLGPRAEKVWQEESNPIISHEAQTYLARHTLSSDISREDTETIDSNFHIIPDFNYIVSSVSFRQQQSPTSSTSMSLSLLLHRNLLETYLPIYRLSEERLKSLAVNLKTLLSQENTTRQQAVDKLTQYALKFQEYIRVHLECKLEPVKIPLTFFSSSKAYKPDFLAKAITSHLQTFCCSVVTGTNEEEINYFIDSLSFFFRLKEHRLSSHVTKENTYIPDLFLQGIVRKSKEDANTIPGCVVESFYPTTWIDLTNKVVKQSPLYNKHHYFRSEYFQPIGKENTEIEMAKKRGSKFTTVRTAAPFVEKLLELVYKLPLSLRRSYIQLWVNLLYRKAIVLIKYRDSKRLEKKTQDQSSLLIDKKEIKEILDLESDAEFYTLLAAAEKLEPNIFHDFEQSIKGMEKRFQQYFI